MIRPIRIAAPAAMALAAFLLSGCPFSTNSNKKVVDPPPPIEYKPRTSIENLLLNLEQAYVNREAAEYESLLAEDFEFYFSEEDQHIAVKLNRDDEIGVHQRMFSASEVQGIELSFSEGQIFEDDTTPDPKYPDRFLWTITLTNVDLKLHATNDQGVLVTHHLDNGVEQFWFREEAWTDPDTGDNIWTIVQWREFSQ